MRAYITDEVNPSYTADVLGNKSLKAGRSTLFYDVASGALTSAVISSAPCWLHSVNITQNSAATATEFVLFDAAVSAAGGVCISASANRIARWAVGTTSGTQCRGSWDFDCYCDTGLTYCLSAGNMKGITVTYST